MSPMPIGGSANIGPAPGDPGMSGPHSPPVGPGGMQTGADPGTTAALALLTQIVSQMAQSLGGGQDMDMAQDTNIQSPSGVPPPPQGPGAMAGAPIMPAQPPGPPKGAGIPGGVPKSIAGPKMMPPGQMKSAGAGGGSSLPKAAGKVTVPRVNSYKTLGKPDKGKPITPPKPKKGPQPD